jgi:hypothetical protein
VLRPALRTKDRSPAPVGSKGAIKASTWVLPLREYYLASEQTLDELAQLNFALVGLSPEDGAKFPSQLSGVAFDGFIYRRFLLVPCFWRIVERPRTSVALGAGSILRNTMNPDVNSLQFNSHGGSAKT